MLMLLSPAKMLDFDPAPKELPVSKPQLNKDTKELEPVVKKLSRAQIKRLMGISDNLADLNYERFQAFKSSGRIVGAKQAALTFAGEVYRGLDAQSLSKEDLEYAQDHVRILSGLYGLLRPLDGIQPYRLEMGSRLKNARGDNLHAFWKPVLSSSLDKAIKGHDDPTIVCLASNEYAKAVDRKTLKAPFLTFNFKETKDGKSRAIMLYVKQARGMMARWAIENRIAKTEDLKNFSVGGYKFSKSQSTDHDWVFTRAQPKPKGAPKKNKAA